MKAAFLCGIVSLLMIGCSSAKSPSTSKDSLVTIPINSQQLENKENSIYFRAAGNEPFWSLKMSESNFEFSYFTTKLQTFNAVPTNPIVNLDSNTKIYRLETQSGQMNIIITQSDCKDSMTGVLSPYTVEVEFKLGTAPIFTTYKGCGEYITDDRLHDTWILESMNGKLVSKEDFSLGFPTIEINTKSNHFYGFAGCNAMSGSLFFEKELLRFNKIATTRKMCQTQNKESDFINALQNIGAYDIVDQKLILKNNTMDSLVFKRVN